MSDVLSDKLLSNLQLIAATLREWRQGSFADARIVNSLFDVRVLDHEAPMTSTGHERILDADYSRVYVMFAAPTGGVCVIPGTGLSRLHGLTVSGSMPLIFSIRDSPGLVAMDWYYGQGTAGGALLYTIEVLDRRRR